MKTIQNLILYVILACLAIFNAISAQEQTLSSITNKYTTKLKQENKGVGILIKKNNNTETTSLGNFDLNGNTVFNVGSATKTFTAILILQEEEKGTLQLTDSIGAYLSPIKNVDGSLTIESLLKHQSGLGEIVGRDTRVYFYATKDSVYRKNVLNKFPKSDPSMVGHYSYCNSNYILLGKIIEKVTDKDYFDLLRERIFIPLQMDDSYPYVSKTIKNLARPYDKNKDVYELLDYRFFADYAFSAGSIASTLFDMEKFYTGLFETEILLKKETVNKMLPSAEEKYGLGLMTYTHDNTIHYGHGGNNIGYAFRNTYDPTTKNLVLLFSNNRSIPFKASIQKDMLDYSNSKKVTTSLNQNIVADFKDFVGEYNLVEANAKLEIVAENNEMYMLIQGQKVLLAYEDINTLYDVKVGVRLQRKPTDKSIITFRQDSFKAELKRVTK
ncbi:serine hydrolase [Aquimarina sp. AU119]|uniref:serine hydrolase domain-containing protein n=1 Tax=Aquimarina sp. AU119 TaxID=2108528 RepID=UPI000D692A1E|nr:serine hydrolase domain-containing protein [Aquimarina sp. AU119]